MMLTDAHTVGDMGESVQICSRNGGLSCASVVSYFVPSLYSSAFWVKVLDIEIHTYLHYSSDRPVWRYLSCRLNRLPPNFKISTKDKNWWHLNKLTKWNGHLYLGGNADNNQSYPPPGIGN